MGFWTKIRSIFKKNNEKELNKRFDNDELVYNGEETNCWACQMPIHDTQKSRKLNGRRLHIFCFRKIKKIALNGGGVDEFSK